MHWDTFSENCMILASAFLSQYTRVTDDDRRHFMVIAELAMQLQRSLKLSQKTDSVENSVEIFPVGIEKIKYDSVEKYIQVSWNSLTF